MNINEFIDEKINEARMDDNTTTLNQFSDDFIYLFGPYMCMCPSSWERECDEIAKSNMTMKFMNCAAVLLRYFNSNISYERGKEFIKEYIIAVDKDFSSDSGIYNDEKETLQQLAIDMLKSIRTIQLEQKDLESFMIASSPIVTYQETIKKPTPPIKESLSIIGTREKELVVSNKNTEDRRMTLHQMLLENSIGILQNASLAETWNESQDINKIPIEIDKLVAGFSGIDNDVKMYYLLAFINYNRLPSEPFSKYFDILHKVADFSTTSNYRSFESMIDELSKFSPVMESLDSYDMEEKENAAVNVLMQNSLSKNNQDSATPKYDMTILDNYIYSNRFYQFNEAANRFFVSSLEKTNIISYNYMDGGRCYYEMSNDSLVCPCISLADYSIKLLVLRAGSTKVDVLSDFSGMY